MTINVPVVLTVNGRQIRGTVSMKKDSDFVQFTSLDNTFVAMVRKGLLKWDKDADVSD